MSEDHVRPSEPFAYGIDAPELVRLFIATAVGAALAGTGLARATRNRPPAVRALCLPPVLVATYAAGMATLMLSWSAFVKVRTRERALDRIAWRGDERVLDVGCGRGLLLVGAALRLETGTAIGVDIWSAKDQSGNTLEAARRNARRAGVSSKVDVRTADMRALPFDDRSFDVVVTHWAVHNIDDEGERARAFAEMTRVLRIGGRLIVCDIEHRDEYLARLASLGFVDRRISFGRIADRVLGAISFGSFRPFTIVATLAHEFGSAGSRSHEDEQRPLVRRDG